MTITSKIYGQGSCRCALHSEKIESNDAFSCKDRQPAKVLSKIWLKSNPPPLPLGGTSGGQSWN